MLPSTLDPRHGTLALDMKPSTLDKKIDSFPAVYATYFHTWVLMKGWSTAYVMSAFKKQLCVVNGNCFSKPTEIEIFPYQYRFFTSHPMQNMAGRNHSMG